MADNHASHNTLTTAKGSLWLIVILGLLLFSACGSSDTTEETDRLNDLAYSFHYRNQDSTLYYANKAIQQATDNYGDGKAEALNNLAFTDIRRLQFDKARERLDKALELTDNQIELMIAYVQKMHIDRLSSENREFYTNKEKADACLRRIEEEKGMLTERQQRRRIYAETEYRLVCADYYRVLGQEEKMLNQLQKINPYGEIRSDTAQYLSYLCLTNAVGINKGMDLSEASEHFAALVSVLATARRNGYIYFAALSMMELGEYLLNDERHQYLQTANAAGITYINANEVDSDLLAGWLTESALLNFDDYGDECLSAMANMQLARCCHELQEYHAALDFLDRAVENEDIELVPALMAAVHEQYSVAFSAIDDKQQSDYHRNLFLDLRELTRQDRYFESRAEQLDTMSAQQNMMIALAFVAILLLVFLLHYFNYLSKKPQRNSGLQEIVQAFGQWEKENEKEKAKLLDDIEAIEEQTAIVRNKAQKGEEDNLEARAKVQMLNGVMPLIDRIKHEVNMLKNRSETEGQRAARYEYITEIAQEIDRNNDILTKWIELKQGQIRLQIETFALQPIFDIIEKNKSSFSAKGITLKTEHTDCLVKADKTLTVFMLNTLADNARKFTQQGGSVTISSSETDGYVEISVVDTGCGLTEEQQKTIFTRQISAGHGFGLLNCRGIMEKYKKASRLFAPCMLAVESRVGEGSRFFFRLPRGMAKTVIAILAAMNIVAGYAARQADADMQTARQYADSAYYSNIAATYERTLMFSDSCRKYLNLHYSHAEKGNDSFMLRTDDGSVVAPEIQWLRDSADIDFNVILDIRNETAVAALALHEWDLYRYNNDIYTQLFQELSADNTIGDYCRTMEQQQTNKDIAIMILTIVLLMIIPGYYFMFYRKRLRTRREAARQKAVEIDQTKEKQMAEKAALRDRLEMLNDELDLAEQELAALHVSNSILDNCLSAIKHETMYYPSRIIQMVENGSDAQAIDELVTYYREIYSMLGSQTQSQTRRSFLHVKHMQMKEILPFAPASIYVTGDKDMMQYLFRILKRHVGERLSEARIDVENRRNVVIEIEGDFNNDIDYMLCRQILREHGEATANRACGIVRGNGRMELTLCGGTKE